MKTVIIVMLTILSFQSVAQTFDSLYYNIRGKKVNFRDNSGRKQGEWLYYRLTDCTDSSFYSVVADITTIGYYADDKKIGTWEFYLSKYDPCSEGSHPVNFLKKVQYTDDSILTTGYTTDKLWQAKSYEIISNQDSSVITAKVYDSNDAILGVCFKDKSSDTTICRLLGGENRDFVRKEYVFETIEEVFTFVECGYRCWN
ncbi:MAG: hypothetical protein ACOYN5_13085 [Bacteroidales bacterium]